MPTTIGNDYLLRVVMHVLNYVLPSDVIQKILLLAIFTLAGWGMHRLVIVTLGPSTQRLPAYVGGTFYVINPFTYDRLMAGQYYVLFGYALMPWLVWQLLRLTRQPTLRNSLLLGLWAVGISVVSIHSIGVIAVVAAVASTIRSWQSRAQLVAVLRLIGLMALSAAVWLTGSSYWLFATVLGGNNTAESISRFTNLDRQAFATTGTTVIERIGNTLGLQGFWTERHGLFILPQEVIPGWVLLMLAVMLFVMVGAVGLWRQDRELATVYISCTVIGALLASGVGIAWLASNVPFFAGYREPQKFAMLVALGYGVLIATASQRLLNRLHTSKRLRSFAGLIGGALLGLPWVITPTMAFGANNQLQPVSYPAGWYATNHYLNRDRDDFQTLVLPWHLYMYYGFAGRIIANPTPNFFDKPVIISADPELEGAAMAKPTVAKQRVAKALQAAPNSTTKFGINLAALDVKYIVLIQDNDFKDYDYLNKQTNLSLVKDYGSLRLYHNNAYIKASKEKP